MRILLVEDDVKLGLSLKQGLEEELYAVDLIRDGNTAAIEAMVNEYDVIVLDIRLPGKNGYELCQEWREDGLTTPIIMLTANDGLNEKVKGLDTGADDYITKPFEFDELLARIRALIRRNNQRVVPKLIVADIILDPATHVVTRSGKKINLSPLEYRLLEYLMENKGLVRTRRAIGEHAWEMNFDSDTNVIDVYINYLRKKIDVGFSPSLIHTVRGVGYILEDR